MKKTTLKSTIAAIMLAASGAYKTTSRGDLQTANKAKEKGYLYEC